MLLPSLLVILFTGCDYWCMDEYHVINNTDDTLRIVVNYDTLRLYGGWKTGENIDSQLDDTTHIVYPHSQIILEEGAELCGKYYKPDDYRYEDKDLQFWGKWIQNVYVNSSPIESAYWIQRNGHLYPKTKIEKILNLFLINTSLNGENGTFIDI